jgi:hypothetical protein
MEITPNSNVEPTVRAVVGRAQARAPQPDTDTAVFIRTEALEQTLQATPRVRPEMVARARQCIGDPHYPSKATTHGIAALLVMKLTNGADAPAQNQT